MAKMKLAKRKYSFSDSALAESARNVAIGVEMKPSVFLPYGITETYIDNFRIQRNEFIDLPPDHYFIGTLKLATDAKDKLSEKLMAGIRTVRTMAGNKWGQKNALYRCYDFDGLSGLSDEKLHRLGKRVVKLATQQLADLASEGLTAAFISDLQTTNSAFDTAIDEQEEAIIQRDIATQERIESGNQLFKIIMKLARIGQNIYRNTDPALFKQFLIYHTSDGKPGRKKKTVAPVA